MRNLVINYDKDYKYARFNRIHIRSIANKFIMSKNFLDTYTQIIFAFCTFFTRSKNVKENGPLQSTVFAKLQNIFKVLA